MNDLSGKVAVCNGCFQRNRCRRGKVLGGRRRSRIVNYASDQKDADTVVAQIIDDGGRALAVRGNVAQQADVSRLFEETKRAFGKLDILVNNAGVFKFAPVENFEEQDFHRRFNTNVLGTILAIQSSLALFGREGGSVINLSSAASIGRMPDMVVYAATKAAVDSVTRTLAAELASKRIQVNAVAPGTTATEGTAAMGYTGDRLDQAAAGIPLGHVALPKEIASVVMFLASDASSHVTGERIQVSGGQYF